MLRLDDQTLGTISLESGSEAKSLPSIFRLDLLQQVWRQFKETHSLIGVCRLDRHPDIILGRHCLLGGCIELALYGLGKDDVLHMQLWRLKTKVEIGRRQGFALRPNQTWTTRQAISLAGVPTLVPEVNNYQTLADSHLAGCGNTSIVS